MISGIGMFKGHVADFLGGPRFSGPDIGTDVDILKQIKARVSE